MNIMYKCSFCKNVYDWYEGVHENPNGSGVFVKANSFILKSVDPIDVDEDGAVGGTAQECQEGLNTYINLCPDCMRKLLDNLHINGNNAWYSA